MSKEVIIGRGMTSPFAIPNTAMRVSSKHAKITIDDNDRWTLEDLGSTNGTFIKDSNGNLVQIGKTDITRNTVIILADQTIHGFQFKASNIIQGATDDYSSEFLALQQLRNKLEQDTDDVYRKAKFVKYLPSVLIVVVMMVISLCIEAEHRFILMGAVSAACTAIVSAVYDPQTHLRRISDQRRQKLVCPNPQCGKQLSDHEINKGQCLSCKAH